MLLETVDTSYCFTEILAAYPEVEENGSEQMMFRKMSRNVANSPLIC
jgi:hypothetical protein